MAKKTRTTIITINWLRIGYLVLSIFKFIKWPVTSIVAVLLLSDMPGTLREIRIDWDMLLRYIDTIIWPIVVLASLGFIKPNLPNLLDRLEELNLLGGKAKFAQRQNLSTKTKANDLKEIDPKASQVTTKTADEFQITDDETHAQLTSYDAAVAYAQLYKNIYGTQIEVLKTLLDYNNGLTSADLSGILEQHKRLSNSKGHTDLVSFMQYLLRNTLALYNPNNQVYQLTNAGYYFLVYLSKIGELEEPKGW